MIVTVGLNALAPCDVISVTRRDIGLELSAVAREAMVTSRQVIDELAVQPESVYGVSTGFGSLATRHLRAGLLNSGDLASLAQATHALTGEGMVHNRDSVHGPAPDALGADGPARVNLRAKEGLALINGTDGMPGMLASAHHDFTGLLRVVDVAAAMTIEALLCSERVFRSDLQKLPPHPGQVASAGHLSRSLARSPTIVSYQTPEHTSVQDAYSLRCASQVHGAACDTLAHARRVADTELVSAIDNPVANIKGGVESNGSFQAAPIGFALDFLALDVADLASMSERRSDRLLDVTRNRGVPAFLADDPGVRHMIAEYTRAAIVSELERFAAPASVDSIVPFPISVFSHDSTLRRGGVGERLRRTQFRTRGGLQEAALHVPHNRSAPKDGRVCGQRPNPPPKRPMHRKGPMKAKGAPEGPVHRRETAHTTLASLDDLTELMTDEVWRSMRCYEIIPIPILGITYVKRHRQGSQPRIPKPRTYYSIGAGLPTFRGKE